ncbi:hypothetical protein PBY51_001205 [Eleginops maclovinus]|uniref:Uncharacterized protein n=1 Tax=Eleginops maclovinus TaxID=56733 RepID=A0AAN7XNT2_ELEMC|nr:hypothetical protein PBY51_001205 [Eleginops maclovinus]
MERKENKTHFLSAVVLVLSGSNLLWVKQNPLFKVPWIYTHRPDLKEPELTRGPDPAGEGTDSEQEGNTETSK